MPPPVFPALLLTGFYTLGCAWLTTLPIAVVAVASACTICCSAAITGDTSDNKRMGTPGEYVLRIKCDYLHKDGLPRPYNCHHAERIALASRAECIKEAKRLGWHVTPTRAFCPEHDRRPANSPKAEA